MKAAEFNDLVIGNMTVVQYENRFSKLSRYAPHMVANEQEKVKKLLSGLAPYIYEKISPFQIENDSEAFKKALVIEQTSSGVT